MKLFFAIFNCRFKSLFQYRLAAAAGVITQIVWAIVKIEILTAFYTSIYSPASFPLLDAVAYIWIAQALFQLLPLSIDKDIEAQIKNGNIIYELMRPVDFFTLLFSRSLALRLTPTLMRSFPLLFIAYFFFEFPLPSSLPSTILFFVSVIFSLLLSSAITTFMMISIFWTFSGEGIRRLFSHIIAFFSGMLIPLPLFPSWMQTVLKFQPFRGLFDIPSGIYTGVIPFSESLFALSLQLFWLLFFVLLSKWLFEKALWKIKIYGG